MRISLKKLYLLLLIGLIGLSCCQQKETTQSTDNVKTFAHETERTGPLSGQETANIVADFYQILGPRLGSHLLEPNAVITLAGLRGRGNFLTHNLTQVEKNSLEKLNAKAQALGIKFTVHDDIEDNIVDITIGNLYGYEYASKLSKLPFMIPFNAASGGDGFKKWLANMRNNVRSYFEKNAQQNNREKALVHLDIGLQFGYPDQALLDAFDIINRDLPYSTLVGSEIPYSKYYKNPEPNFDYLREHKDDPGILQTEKAWGTLLEEFYKSEWHKTVAKDPVFIEAVKSEQNLHDAWFKKYRLHQ